MIVMNIILIVLITILILSILLLYIIFYNNNLYNIIFERKQRKFWKFIIRNADKFEYIDSPNITCKYFCWGDYLAIVWNDKTCSIHIDTPTKSECIVSDTDKIMSNKMKDLLLSKIN